MSQATPQDVILKVTNLAAQYGKVSAVMGASLDVRAGSIVTVIGANGAGKSTLLNAMMGALPSVGRSTGSVRYQGEEISHWEVERRVAGGISLVPERRELFGSMTVEDNLLLGGFRLYRARQAGWRDTLDQVYALFPRLKERRGQLAGTLSGGERQMLAVGRPPGGQTHGGFGGRTSPGRGAPQGGAMLDVTDWAWRRASCARSS